MFSISLMIPDDPPIICPICLSRLHGSACWILAGVGFCRQCAATVPDRLILRAAQRSVRDPFCHWFTLSRGVRWFTPPRTTTISQLTYLLAPSSCDEPITYDEYSCSRCVEVPYDLTDHRPIVSPK